MRFVTVMSTVYRQHCSCFVLFHMAKTAPWEYDDFSAEKTHKRYLVARATRALSS